MIGSYGLLITIAVLGSLALALLWLEMETKKAISVSFLTLAFAQLWHVFNMRDPGSGFFQNDIIRNRFVWGALVLCCGLLLLAVYLPGLSHVLQVVHPETEGWSLVLAMSLIPWLLGQLLKRIGFMKT
jgi:Ca2+-transporting ATPase